MDKCPAPVNLRDLLAQLEVSIEETLRSDSFLELSDRMQIYALLTLVTKNWWLDFSSKYESLGIKPQALSRPEQFLKKPLNLIEKKANKHLVAWFWMAEKNPELSVLMQAAKQKIEALRSEEDQLSPTPEALLLRRLEQGLNTALESSFKLPVLIDKLLDSQKINSLEDQTFKEVAERSKGILNTLARQHLKIFSWLRAQSELGDPGMLPGSQRDLEGFAPNYFDLNCTNGRYSVQIRKPKTKRDPQTFDTIKNTLLDKDRSGTLHEKAMGCPALYAGIIPQLSQKVTDYYLACKKTKVTTTLSFADWLNSKGL